jgi:hypothetical protein
MAEGDGDRWLRATESERARMEDEHVHPDIRRTLKHVLREALMNRGRMEDVEEAERLAEAAEPGEWRVADGRVIQYSGPPVERPESLRFMARARSLVPTLVRVVYALRKALIRQIANAMSARSEWLREKEALDRHRKEVAQAAGTGPEREFATILSYIRARAFDQAVESIRDADPTIPPYRERWTGTSPDPDADILRRWAAGHSVEAEIRDEVNEGVARKAAWISEVQQNRAKLADEVKEMRRLFAELREGRIPPELEPKKKGRAR